MWMGLKNICCFLLQKVFYTVDEFLNYCSQIKSNCLFRSGTTDRVILELVIMVAMPVQDVYFGIILLFIE